MAAPHYTYSCQLWLPLPPEKVFPFFSDAFNLARITPPELAFNVLTKPPIDLRPGCLIDYRVRWLGFPLRWTTRIEAFDPPHYFIDAQIRGPYSLWHHEHTFAAHNGGTAVGDTVQYRLPFGPVGRLTHTLLVRRQVEAIFTYRQQKIRELLVAPS
jgi:ligand-binding SRPBCC domain-containing protein